MYSISCFILQTNLNKHFLESFVLTTSVIECQLTCPQSTCDQHLINSLINSQPSVDRTKVHQWKLVNCQPRSQSSVDRASTKVLTEG